MLAPLLAVEGLKCLPPFWLQDVKEQLISCATNALLDRWGVPFLCLCLLLAGGHQHAARADIGHSLFLSLSLAGAGGCRVGEMPD